MFQKARSVVWARVWTTGAICKRVDHIRDDSKNRAGVHIYHWRSPAAAQRSSRRGRHLGRGYVPAWGGQLVHVVAKLYVAVRYGHGMGERQGSCRSGQWHPQAAASRDQRHHAVHHQRQRRQEQRQGQAKKVGDRHHRRHRFEPRNKRRDQPARSQPATVQGGQCLLVPKKWCGVVETPGLTIKPSFLMQQALGPAGRLALALALASALAPAGR